jgi:hypothetical protein
VCRRRTQWRSEKKLEKLAPIAEIVSSAAIVLTLIYLTVQTQQTNDA